MAGARIQPTATTTGSSNCRRDLGADRLTRDDNLYNLILILGHNDRPRVKGRGSAIFVHLARPGYAPTAGCIALSRHDLSMLLAQLRRGSAIYVLP